MAGRALWMVAAAVLHFSLFFGCRTATAPNADISPRPRLTSAVSVQQTPLFRQAQAAYRRNERALALALLTRLRKSRDWPAADQEYLERQQAICRNQADAGAAASPGRTHTVPTAQESDCGARALRLALENLGIKTDLVKLRRLSATSEKGASMAGLKRAAEAYGVKAEGIQVDSAALKGLPTPAVAWVNGNHYVAVLKVEGDSATIRDPNSDREEVIAADEVIRRSGGILLTLRPPLGPSNQWRVRELSPNPGGAK